MLLDAKACVTIPSERLGTALDCARRNGHAECIALLEGEKDPMEDVD